MAFESEIKKEIAALRTKLDQLNLAYQRYFMGEEKLPPAQLREQYDRELQKTRDKANKSINTAEKFLMANLYNLYQSFKGRWEKRMREKEDGAASPHSLKKKKKKKIPRK